MKEDKGTIIAEFDNITIVKTKFGDNPSFYGFCLGKDRRDASVDNNLDRAVLMALGRKYLGLNNQFAEFASKMLGMED